MFQFQISVNSKSLLTVNGASFVDDIEPEAEKRAKDVRLAF